MYNFLFDKKSLALLLTGTVVAGGMLFLSGVLVGVQWGLPLDAAPAVAPRPPAPKPAALRAAVPCQPAPEPAAPKPEPKPEPVPAPAPDLRASAEPAPPQPVPAPPVALQAVSRSPQPAPEPTPAPGDAAARYSLQIGAFREAKNSEKVIQELQSKGYEPYVVEQKGRSVLQTVRVGRYADRAEALRAASDFRRREGMEAIVRPLGS